MQNININLIENNTGQLDSVPQNPRDLTNDSFDLAKKSIAEFPEMLQVRTLVVVPKDNKYVTIGGNQRLRAMRDLGYTEAPCVVVDWNSDQIQRFIIADNLEYGVWNYDMLANDWDAEQLIEWGLDLPDYDIMDNYENDKEQAGNLVERFGIPPFSILDTRQKYWLNRKNSWLKITGDLSETKENVLSDKNSILSGYNGGSSNFDPVLAEMMMKWFCPVNGKILDPFGGEQTKGVVAGELGFNYYANEFRQDQVNVNINATKQYPSVHYSCGDSEFINTKILEREFDLCFTSPPYYDLEIYSKEDMSAFGTYEEFMAKYEKIFAKCVEMMADNSFLVIKIGEIRNKKNGIYRNFVGDNIALFIKLGLNYYNELILINMIGTAGFRVNNSFKNRKMVKVHQNVLVFVKGSPEKAAAKCGEIDMSEFDDFEIQQ